MKFDDLFEHMGDMGLYQGLVFTLASLISVFGVEAISVNFIVGYMDHWCRVEELAQVPFEDQKYIAVPETAPGVYSQCQVYALNYSQYSTDDFRQWNRTVAIDNETGVTSCDTWTYDQSEFVSTAMSQYDLVCDKTNLVPLVSTLFMAGVMVGSFISGPLSDRIGRRPTILVFLAVKLASGFLSAYSPNFAVFATSRFFLGLGTFSAYLVAYVLVMELVGPVYRTFLGVTFQMAYSVGMLVLSGMAHAIRDHQWLTLAETVPVGVFVVFYWLIPESPRWLLLQQRHQEAEKIIKHMASVNRKSLPADFDICAVDKEECEEVSSANILDLFRSPTLRNRALVICLYWFTVNLIYYALSFNIGALSGSVFVNTVISGAVEIPANLLCILLCNWRVTGRRLTCCLALLFAGVSCFIRVPMITQGLEEVDTALSMVGRAFVTVGFSAIYVYAAEIFPTEIRNAGLGMASVCAQVSGMVASYVGGPLSGVWEPLPAVIFGVLSLLSGFLVLILPETLGHQLFERIDEAEHFAGKPSGRLYNTTQPATPVEPAENAPSFRYTDTQLTPCCDVTPSCDVTRSCDVAPDKRSCNGAGTSIHLGYVNSALQEDLKGENMRL